MDFGDDVVGLCGPRECLCVVVVMLDILFDGRDEVRDRSKDAAANSLVGQVPKPSFHQVEPGTARRNEMDVESWVSGEPPPNLGIFVRGVVVDDQMQIETRVGTGVDGSKELDPLLMPFHALADDDSLRDVEGREESRGAVAFVVVGHRSQTTGIDRQALLRSIERLDLALFVATEHDRVFRRIQVKPNDIDQLLFETRVVGDLEGFDSMRLEAVKLPDSLHRRAADADRLGHCPQAPVGRGFRCFPRRLVENLRHHPCWNRGFAARPRRILFDASQTQVGETPTPKTDRRPPRCQRLSDLLFSRP